MHWRRRAEGQGHRLPDERQGEAQRGRGFSRIVYKSRKHRDAVNKKVMADPRFSAFDPKDMPADMLRMIYGGFKAIVKL